MPVKIHIAIAVFLYVFDALVFSQGILGLFSVLYALAVLLPLWLAARGDDRELAERRGTLALTYGILGIAVLGTVLFNNRLATRRAERVIAACQRYKVDNKVYPETLEELVPKYLPSVPKAKLAFMYSDFFYSASPDHHRLTWTVFPPFGRRWYAMEGGIQGRLD